MIDNISFPKIGNLKPVIWFGILAMIANLLAIVSVRFVEKRTNINDHKSTVTTLFFTDGLMALVTILFGLSGNFMMGAVTFWMISMFREARGPIYDAWTNQNLEPKIRATVFSMCSQANALGQIVGGPILGLIATMISLRLSIVLAGLILIPIIIIYINSIKRHRFIDLKYVE
jgi:DHA3 family tetracycline resistance protein-like MFS transporter